MENLNNQTVKRKEDQMFTLAESLTIEIIKLVDEFEVPDEGIVIPNSGGQVLIKAGTTAFKDRENNKMIFKIPFKMEVVRNGVEIEESYFVCTE